MGNSWEFLTFRYTRRIFLQGIQFLHRTRAVTNVREQTKQTPHFLTDAYFLEQGQGNLAVTNHYIAFLHQNKKAMTLFPLLSITDWGIDTIDRRPVFWIEGSFEQGAGRFSWYVSKQKEIIQTVNEQLEKGAVAQERAAFKRNQAKLDSYMAIVNTTLNDNSETILLKAKVAIDDKADTLLQNTQVMLETMWEVFLTGEMPQLRALDQAEARLLRDNIVCYAAIKGNRIAKMVLEARGYMLPAEDVFIDSDAFIDEYYKAVLPPFEILDKVHEDVLAIYRTFFPASRLNQDQALTLVSEAVKLGYRVTIANAMVIVKTSLRIAN
ncbi:hypothetical protein [Paenibacillus planticolens]|uniref:Uncharacterized protein n=1 Tax=Paenibacillus planticolens TaxID=2654976 RepID=A0ABX1ZJ80_9BACL|nr:hypothetical protein [Paenibacillus planticolens]NOV00152.1 hypothetical protein [Paenibacillus planticolens]